MAINISDCKQCKVFDTCHAHDKTSCCDMCKISNCYHGDKIKNEVAEFKNNASFDCIILDKNNQYVFIDFKNVNVFIKKENKLENIKKKFESSKKMFNINIARDVIVVFIDGENVFATSRAIMSYVNKNNPLKLKDGQQYKIVYKFCKTGNNNISFEEYLKESMLI